MMAKTFGIHEVELLPGVTSEEFENFANSEYNPFFTSEKVPFGIQSRIVKGDKGERNNQYAVVMEFPSVELRNEIAGTPPQESPFDTEKSKEFFSAIEEIYNKFYELCKTTYTDYYEI